MAKQAPRRAIALGATAMSTARQVERVSVGVEGFNATVNGLIVEGDPQMDAWEEIGKRLRVLERGAQFALGDFLNQVEDRFAEEASQIVDASEWSEKTCSSYRWLAKSIEFERRRMDRLGVAHHLEVAALSPAAQVKWLTKAADDENAMPWTVARLRQEMKAGGEVKPTAWWVLVRCENEKDQRKFMEQMEKSGRIVKATVRRERVGKKAKKKKAGTP
jgi:hypothetical protein